MREPIEEKAEVHSSIEDAAAAPDILSEDDLESRPEGDNDTVSAIHADAESSQEDCRDQKGESFLYQKRRSKLIV